MPLPNREELESRYGQMVAEQQAREAAAARQITQGVGGAVSGFGTGLMDQVRAFKQYAESPLTQNYARDLLTMNPRRSGYTELAEMGKAALDPQTYKNIVTNAYEQITGGPESFGRFVGQNINPFSRLGGVAKRDIFIGENARTWDAAAANRAVEMEKAGHTPEAIWQETGTIRGPEGKLRQEISDANAHLDYEFVPETKNALDWADHWLKERGYITKRGIDVLSPAIPEEIRKEALNYGKSMVGKSVVTRPLEEAFMHGPLLNAYPEMFGKLEIGREPSGTVRGRYSENVVTTGGGGLINSNEVKPELSTLLHELQHAVQEHEGFARGGNLDIARTAMQQQFSKEMQPFQSALKKRLMAAENSGAASRAQYSQKLKDLEVKENIRPRQLLNLSDWYQYGTKVSEELGYRGYGWQMPRQKGATRDRWINEAVRTMRRMIEEENPEMRFADSLMTPNQAKQTLAKTSKIFRETQEQAISASRLQDKYSALREKSDFDLYQRLAGEAESRAVQARMGMTPAERRATFPTYDVPIKELIIRRD